MSIILSDIVDKKVYPIIIRNCGNEYLTLYYYNENDDSILHSKCHLICFDDYSQLQAFCTDNSLEIENGIHTFDFDLPIIEPTDCKSVLENWNLLNTISNIFQMYFEGNSKKYNALYDLLFRYNTSVTNLPQTVAFNEKMNNRLIKVFKKKNRLLNRFLKFTRDGETTLPIKQRTVRICQSFQ